MVLRTKEPLFDKLTYRDWIECRAYDLVLYKHMDRKKALQQADVEFKNMESNGMSKEIYSRILEILPRYKDWLEYLTGK
jgi:hypothetical protein